MSERFPLRFGRLGWLVRACGITREGSYVDAGPDTVEVRAGFWFRASIPRSSIRSVERGPDRPFAIGVHGFRGSWIVNGAASPITRIVIAPPAPARTIVFRIRLRELEVGVTDSAGLIAALAPSSEGSVGEPTQV